MTAEASQKELLDFVHETALVAKIEWTTINRGGAQDCTLPSGRTGVAFPIWALGPGSAAPDVVMDRVRAFWKERGFDLPVEHVEFGALQITYPLDDEGFTIQFGINENSSDMTTVSRCAVGDADEINAARHADDSEPRPTP